MRKRATWMNVATDPVLELLDDTALALPVGVIHYNIDRKVGGAPSRSTINRAISTLETYRLVRKAPDSKTYYEITEDGRRYLRGELDASELDPAWKRD